MPYVTRKVPETEETDGLGGTEQTPTGKSRNVTVWVPPEDKREAHLVRHGRIVVVFTVLAMALSVAAIGGYLGQMVTAPVAYTTGGLFDALWAFALYTEWLAHTNRRVRIAAQVAGLVFMALSAVAIAAEGFRLGYPMTGVIAAMIPLCVKATWWMRFAMVMPKLSKAQQKRLEDDLATIAVKIRNAEAQLQLDARLSQLGELRAAAHDGGSVTAQAQRLDQHVDPVNRVSEPTRSPAQLSSAQRLRGDRLTRLTELIRDEPELTPAQAAHELGVSLATAKRDLRQVRN